MKAFLAIFIYLIMALILGAGVLVAVLKGSFWLMIIGFLGFVLAVAKIAILPHSH